MSPTPTLNGQELELFRVGDYSAIKKGKYTPDDMAGIVARYSAAGESPVAIGHPAKDSEPAFGWIKSVRFDGATGVLHGTFGDVHPVLDKGWNEKQYRNRSLGFGRDPQGELYIHHVAMLGAVPPIVQGLKDAKTFSGNDLYEEIDFSDGDDMDDAKVKQSIADGIREFFSSHFGGRKSEGTVDVEALKAELTQWLTATFSTQLEAERAERKKVEDKFSALESRTNGADAQVRATSAINELKAAGAWVPAYEKLGIPQLFSALAGNVDTITFSDAKGVERKPALLDALTGALKGIGKIVPAEVFAAGAQGGQSKAAPSANGAAVDAASITFSDMVTERAKADKIPWNDAYRLLTAEGRRPEPGSAAAGAV